MLVAFSGRAGSGKDTAANVLMSAGFLNIKMSGPLKEMMRAYLRSLDLDDEYIERCIEGDLKEVPNEYFEGKTPRYAMQTLGTEWGRELIGHDLWVNAIEVKIKKILEAGGKVVVTDIRLLNEYHMIKRLGGKVFQIRRDLNENIAGDHSSENQIELLTPHYIFFNNIKEEFETTIKDYFLK